jgi:outer membrane protein assembly factor BamA
MAARFFLLSAILILNSNCIQGQTKLFVEFTEPVSDRRLLKSMPAQIQKDSLTTVRSLRRMMADAYDLGYLSFSVDSIRGTRDSIIATVYTGSSYRWAKLNPGDLDEGMLSVAGYRERIFEGKPIRTGPLFSLNRRILKYCEDNGYPFATIQYDEFRFENDQVSARINLVTGKKITIDSLIIRGNSRLSRTYLYSYLSVKPGNVYNESIIRKIPNRIKEMPMVNETRPFSVAFSEETARLILNIDDKKASQIDGIVGILPDNNESGKVQITGDLRIKLLSSFGKGELLDLNWKQPAARTQDLKVRANYPFILSSPFGVDGKLGIYKKDTTYLEVVLGFGVQFLLSGGNYLKVFVDDKKSSLLSTKIFENTTVLPPFADTRRTTYGFGIKSLKVDYRLNPRRGYSVQAEAGAGNRTIRRNGRLNPEVYDSLDLKTVQYTGEFAVDYYFPLFNRNVVNLGIMGATLLGENTFVNELYRFGGLHTLRGFDEESISSSSYLMGKAEFRYILEENSYLFGFYNIAWYERKTRSEYQNDIPRGFGAGITFETRLGIFSFSYALGQEFSNPVRFRAAKVHFGLINYF